MYNVYIWGSLSMRPLCYFSIILYYLFHNLNLFQNKNFNNKVGKNYLKIKAMGTFDIESKVVRTAILNKYPKL